VPQAEPVACRFCHDARGCWTWQCYHCGEIDDVQQPPPLPKQEPVGKVVEVNNDGFKCEFSQHLTVGTKLYTAPPAAPSEWPLIKNILAEYGLDAIAFVAGWKAAQRTWVGLTDEDWAKIEDMPDAFDQGVAWAQARLKERNT